MTEAATRGSPPAPAELQTPGALTPGEQLAQARRANGLSLEGVAQQLKFSPRQIDALEGGRYDELPGRTMVRGMVRSYARLVFLDAGPLLDALNESLAAPDANRIVARYREPVPFSDASKRSNVVYVVFTIAALFAAALVLVQWREDRPAPARMTFVPAAQAPQESPARTTVASASTSVIARPVDAVAADSSAVPAATTDSAPGVVAAADAVGSAEAQGEPDSGPDTAPADAGTGTTAIAATDPADSAAAPRVASPASSKHSVALHFLQDAWVEVRDGDGKVLVSKLNTAGSDMRVEGEGPLSFVIGNAQYVRLTYDDRDVDLAPYIKVAVARFTLQ